MIKVIKDYLKNNNYNGEDLVNYLTSRHIKAYWCARNTNGRSGIIQVGHMKYYFYCVKPWAYCPTGKIIVEEM